MVHFTNQLLSSLKSVLIHNVFHAYADAATANNNNNTIIVSSNNKNIQPFSVHSFSLFLSLPRLDFV